MFLLFAIALLSTLSNADVRRILEPVTTEQPVDGTPKGQNWDCPANNFFHRIQSTFKSANSCRNEMGASTKKGFSIAVSPIAGKWGELIQCEGNNDHEMVLETICLGDCPMTAATNDADKNYSAMCRTLVLQDKSDAATSTARTCNTYDFFDDAELACPGTRSELAGFCFSDENTNCNGAKAQVICCSLKTHIDPKQLPDPQPVLIACDQPYPEGEPEIDFMDSEYLDCAGARYVELLQAGAGEDKFKSGNCVKAGVYRDVHKAELQVYTDRDQECKSYVKDECTSDANASKCEWQKDPVDESRGKCYGTVVTAQMCADACARQPVDLVSTYGNDCYAFDWSENANSCQLFFETSASCKRKTVDEARITESGESWSTCNGDSSTMVSEIRVNQIGNCFRKTGASTRRENPIEGTEDITQTFNVVWPIIIVLALPILCYINYNMRQAELEEERKKHIEAEERMHKNYKRASLANVHYGVELQETSGQSRLEIAQTRQKPGSFRKEDGHLYSMQSMVNMEKEMDDVLKKSEVAVTPAIHDEISDDDDAADQFKQIKDDFDESGKKSDGLS